MSADNSSQNESVHTYELGPDETPSEAIVTVVAVATNQSPLEIAPLAETIDPDAVNVLFDGDAETDSSATFTFRYSGRQVTVTPDEVRVE